MDEERGKPPVNQHHRAWLRRLRQWRRRDWILFSVSGILATCVVYLYSTSPPPAISLANYDRITMGMPEREVERIIQARTGGYGHMYFSGPGERLSQERGTAERWSLWGTRYGVLEVGYDTTGRVCCKRLEYHPSVIPVQPDLWPLVAATH